MALFLQNTSGHQVIEVYWQCSMVVDNHSRSCVRQSLQTNYFMTCRWYMVGSNNNIQGIHMKGNCGQLLKFTSFLTCVTVNSNFQFRWHPNWIHVFHCQSNNTVVSHYSLTTWYWCLEPDRHGTLHQLQTSTSSSVMLISMNNVRCKYIRSLNGL